MKNKIEISYERPTISRRLFSRIVDSLLLTLLTFLLFISIKAIYSNTPTYLNASKTLETIRIDSGLYEYKNNKLMNISTISFQDKKMSYKQKEDYLLNGLNKFFNYIKNYNVDSYKKVIQDYDDFRLSTALTYENHPLFIKENNEIVKNDNYDIPLKIYVENCYSLYIDTNCNGFLTTEIKEYYDSNKLISNFTFYFNIPLSIFVSSIIIFFIPPLIFKRGRKTIGMLIYHIGFVNKNLYNLTIKEYIVKFLFFYFFEFLLSFVTFAIPLLISLTMMLVTKTKQNLNEYFLNIKEVSTQNSIIYNNKSEIIVKKMNEIENINFRMK